MKSSINSDLAVALALGVAACGPREEPKRGRCSRPAAPAGITVKIAHAGPLTGSIAHLGKDDENGVALAVAQANDKKIVIDGKPVTEAHLDGDGQHGDDHADGAEHVAAPRRLGVREPLEAHDEEDAGPDV